MLSFPHKLGAWVAGALALATAQSCVEEPEYACTPEEGAALYERRIAPLFLEDRPSSCNQCHLSGVDLSLFLRDTPCQTMACMVELGLVDLQQPDASLVLQWISRAEPQSELITAAIIAEEREGVAEWIRMSAACQATACPPMDDPCDEPEFTSWRDCEHRSGKVEPDELEDSGSCDDLALEELFFQRVYFHRMRCYPCHFADQEGNAVEEAPKWITAGACETGSLATMRNVLQGGYVDLDDPEQSLLLLKPLDVEAGGVEHGGGAKFHNSDDDLAYEHFLQWLSRYAACHDNG